MMKTNFCFQKKNRNFFFVGYFLFLYSLSFLISCTPTKSTAYFQTITKDTTFETYTPDQELKIIKKDVLSIIISSLSPGDDAFFNGAAIGGGEKYAGFTVSERGTILMHKLGHVAVEGLTRRELQDKLQKDLTPYLKDPIVNIQFVNHKITVFGEVGSPKIIDMPEEQLSLVDILVSSGDVTETGNTDRIMIIRQEDDKKRTKYLNLQDHRIFASPWYYVKPGDIIYVKPDEEKRLKAEKRAILQRNIGFVTAGIGFAFIIVDRLTR